MRGLLLALALVAPAAPGGARAAGKALGAIPAPALPEASGPPPVPPGHVRLELVFPLAPVLAALDSTVPRDLRDPRKVDTTLVDALDRKSEERGGPGYGPEDVHEPAPEDAPYEEPVPWRGMLRRGPWRVSGRADSLALLTRLQYSVDVLLPGRLAARCGSASEPWGGQAGCVARLGWGDGWRIETRARALPSAYEKRCKPKPPGLNFTRRLNAQVDARLATLLPAGLDSAMRRRMDASRRVQRALDHLAEPVSLGDTTTWLRWNVGRVTVDPPRLEGDSITAEVSFETRPEIQPTAGARKPPALGEPDVRLSGDELRVPYDCWVDYADVERAIVSARELAGSIEGPGLGVSGARVRGARDRVVVAVDLTGPLAGTAYLTGRLAVSSPDFRLHALELDWSPQSRRRLREATGGSAGRALQAALEDVRMEVGRAFARPLEDCLRGWERALIETLRPDRDQPASLEANFNRRTVADIFCTDRAIGVHMVTSGRARVILAAGR